MMILQQLGLLVFGVMGAWLVNSPHAAARRWGSLFGLLSQPFWIWQSITAAQWGALLVCILYTVAWGRGVWHGFVKPVTQ